MERKRDMFEGVAGTEASGRRLPDGVMSVSYCYVREEDRDGGAGGGTSPQRGAIRCAGDRGRSDRPGVRHRNQSARDADGAGGQGLPVQLDLSLPGQHDLLYHAGAAGDRRHSVPQP